jgi:hypothetical protein
MDRASTAGTRKFIIFSISFKEIHFINQEVHREDAKESQKLIIEKTAFLASDCTIGQEDVTEQLWNLGSVTEVAEADLAYE